MESQAAQTEVLVLSWPINHAKMWCAGYGQCGKACQPFTVLRRSLKALTPRPSAVRSHLTAVPLWEPSLPYAKLSSAQLGAASALWPTPNGTPGSRLFFVPSQSLNQNQCIRACEQLSIERLRASRRARALLLGRSPPGKRWCLGG